MRANSFEHTGTVSSYIEFHSLKFEIPTAMSYVHRLCVCTRIEGINGFQFILYTSLLSALPCCIEER